MSNRLLSAAAFAAIVGCVLAAVTLPARAALGEAPMATPSGATTTVVSPTARVASASIAAAASGAASPAAAAPYAVHATTYSTGTQVREYVGSDGRVFGLAWNGPRMPELQTLLGNYFPEYASGVKAQRTIRRGRGPVAVEQTDLVVHSGGHMGSFFGQAWLPSALPAGMSGADIK